MKKERKKEKKVMKKVMKKERKLDRVKEFLDENSSALLLRTPERKVIVTYFCLHSESTSNFKVKMMSCSIKPTT